MKRIWYLLLHVYIVTCIQCAPPKLEFLALRMVVQDMLDHGSYDEPAFFDANYHLIHGYMALLLLMGQNDVHTTLFLITYLNHPTWVMREFIELCGDLPEDEKMMIFELAQRSKRENPEELLLHIAQSNNLIAAKILIHLGTDLNTRDAHKQTPLMLASLRGNIEMVRLLLSYGADFDAQNKYGYTALMESGMQQRLDIVELLLDSGANPHIKTTHGMSLFSIKTKRHLYYLKLLLEPYQSQNSWFERLADFVFHRV